MSEQRKYFGHMKPPAEAVEDIKTPYRRDQVIAEWSDKQRKHEWAASKEQEAADNYAERIRLVLEKFPRSEQ